MQKKLESIIEGAVTKKFPTLVVTAMLNRMSTDAMNIVKELLADIRKFCFMLLCGRTVTTNEGICVEFSDYQGFNLNWPQFAT